MAAIAATQGRYSTITLGALGTLGVAVTAGRKTFVRHDVLGRTKQKRSKLPTSTLLGDAVTRRTGLVAAFNELYALDSIVATRSLVPALDALLRVPGSTTPWGSTIDEAGTSNTSNTSGTHDTEALTAELVKGALYFAMQQPTILTGRLSAKVQTHIVAHHPEWLAEYPQHFNRVLVNQQRPGLMDVAIGVHGLHHNSYDRRVALAGWLSNQCSTNMTLRTADIPSLG